MNFVNRSIKQFVHSLVCLSMCKILHFPCQCFHSMSPRPLCCYFTSLHCYIVVFLFFCCFFLEFSFNSSTIFIFRTYRCDQHGYPWSSLVVLWRSLVLRKIAPMKRTRGYLLKELLVVSDLSK